MGESYEQEKHRLRRRVEAVRAALSTADVARLSAAVAARVVAMPALATARHVVVYAAMRNELDPSAIAEHARNAGKALYRPTARDEPPGFVSLDGSRLGLPRGAEHVLVLVPGVAFDARGARLGRGVGWYDRVLADHPRAVRVGLAYDFQVVPSVPEDPWDIRMHAVVTDARLIGEASPTAAQ
jgi:5-formyltetrahydrofolate cyclo-ligase